MKSSALLKICEIIKKKFTNVISFKFYFFLLNTNKNATFYLSLLVGKQIIILNESI